MTKLDVSVSDSQLEGLIDVAAEVEWLADGFGARFPNGATKGVAEGPVWFKAGYLVFSDSGKSKRYRWSDADGLTVDRTSTNEAIGLARDPSGRLIACEHETRRVTREEPDGSLTVVADSYHGFRLNRPNDVVVRSDGAIYFTDPITLGVDSDLDFAGVYRVSPDLGRINLLCNDFILPNGLAFSVDETVLYINDTVRRHIRVFELELQYGSGRLQLGTDRVLYQMDGNQPGHPDGMKLDSQGNIWCTGPGGIWVISPKGEKLGIISFPIGLPVTNLCFGGPTLQSLFITTRDRLGRIPVRVAGHQPLCIN